MQESLNALLKETTMLATGKHASDQMKILQLELLSTKSRLEIQEQRAIISEKRVNMLTAQVNCLNRSYEI